MRSLLMFVATIYHRKMGDWQIPRPKGEGGAKHRVRGEKKYLLFTPHPARWCEPPSPFGRGIFPESADLDLFHPAPRFAAGAPTARTRTFGTVPDSAHCARTRTRDTS